MNYYLGKKFSYKLGYKLITFKRLKLQSCAKSQIVGNSFALLYLMSFFKIGLELIKRSPPEDDRGFFVGRICPSKESAKQKLCF